MKMKLYTATAATIQGADHARKCLNLQDAYSLRHGFLYGKSKRHYGSVAVVTDGCGSGKHSEVGATLLARRLANDLFELLKRKSYALEGDERYAQEGFLNDLRGFVIDRTKAMVSDTMRCAGIDPGVNAQPGEVLDFLNNHLLATVLFAVTLDDRTWLGSCGDGILYVEVPGAPPVVDIHVADQNNRPHYPAFQWIPDEWLTGPLQVVRTVLSPPSMHQYTGATRIVLATDGAERFFRENRVDELFSFEGEKGLQRRLNMGHIYAPSCGKPRPEWTTDDDSTLVLLRLRDWESEPEGGE